MPVLDQIPNHDIPPAAGGGDGGAADAARAGAAPVLQVPPPPGLHQGEHQAGDQYQGCLFVFSVGSSCSILTPGPRREDNCPGRISRPRCDACAVVSVKTFLTKN